MTKEEAKRMLSKLGLKHGVSPKFIALRLLSEEDKQDMLNDLITFENLDCAVNLWLRQKMPDYANGKTEAFELFYVYSNG